MMQKENIKSKKEVAKKVLIITGNVIVYLLMAFAIFVLIISISSKKDADGTATVFGHQLRFVQSNSMEACELTDVSSFEIKSIPVKSCIFIDVVPEGEEAKAEWYKNLKVGDVLTFKYLYSRQETITHRIINIEDKGAGRYIITLEGDNKNAEDGLLQQTIDTSLENSPNYVIGKVTGQSYFLGLLVYAFNSTVGIICLIIVPSVIIITFEVIRLVKVFGKEKKEKLLEEKKKQENEIEELKRQLAELQNKKKEDDSVSKVEVSIPTIVETEPSKKIEKQ
ncbi:MAG: hypothetical protein IKW33_02695 [Clostridia bacterium]|nr:hypothetical protein [Clostridia bacterium]